MNEVANAPENSPRDKESLTDFTATIAELKDVVRQFVAARGWEKFHSPKNLSMSLAIEAAELMEHFQWISIEESRAVRSNAPSLANVGEELADVVSYALALANELGIDLAATLVAKMRKNELKYPSDKCFGKVAPPAAVEASERPSEPSRSTERPS